ncbi:MAG: CoA transferase [Desulfarculaceae bacterium]|nr:CoA transferase [Desulfarculaceae bacterium]MCF8120765.1 CoA transferase [Desulfarculaceae bacterium]
MPNNQHHALEGIKALELSGETVSFCGKLLTDLGAQVTLVQPPARRQSGPKPSFLYFHAGKNGITLNIRHPRGREIFLRLVPEVDVVLEGLPTGALSDLGLGYDTLRRHNPRLIMVSISGFGRSGPRRHWRSDSVVAAATGGWSFINGAPDGPPLAPPETQAYYLGGLNGAVGVLLALRKNRGRENGEHLDISLQECVASSLDHVLPRNLSEGVVPTRQGGAHWNHSFFVLPCRDGHIHLSPFQQWGTLVEWMGDEGMAADLGDEKYLDAQYRLDHLPHVLEVIGRWTKTRGKQELFETARLMRFPWAPVCGMPDVLASPQLAARGFWDTRAEAKAGASLKFPGYGVHPNDSQPTDTRPAPEPGQDNQAVFMQQLGLSQAQMDELSGLGVI